MSKWFYGLVVTVICFIGSLVTWYYKAIWLPGFTDYPAAYGQMGDFFGGLLNPVLAFASFLALLYTIQIQSKQLEISAKELKETKEEIAASRKAQEDLSNTQLTQLFENNFFSQMNYIAGIKESFQKKQRDQANAVSELVAKETPITLAIDMVVSNSPQARMYYSTVLELLRYVDEFMYKSNSWDKASMYYGLLSNLLDDVDCYFLSYIGGLSKYNRMSIDKYERTCNQFGIFKNAYTNDYVDFVEIGVQYFRANTFYNINETGLNRSAFELVHVTVI